jgi:glycosyltransferase involved in cell wall biosynthesis
VSKRHPSLSNGIVAAARSRAGTRDARLLYSRTFDEQRSAVPALATDKRLLMVAFHFPPQHGSSGIQRTLRFARYLTEFGWEPQVLTVHPRAYDAVDDTTDIPRGLVVHRALAFDAARHFAIGGRYPSFAARPDRWASWWWGSIPTGLNVIRRFRPHALWSTYPIATAHRIGHTLARIGRLPWIADFRDPMAQEGYPADPRTWRHFARIEARAVRTARRSVFATPGAARQYRVRYPEHAGRIAVIENGYDEEMFEGLVRAPGRAAGKPLVLLHSGIVYPSERDPTALFAALRSLRARGRIAPGDVVLRFRAPVHDALLHELAARFGVADLIDTAAPLPYRAALAEMVDADGLVVLQAANCNEQIPAKVYEYLRAQRPLLGLADPAGDTGMLLQRSGVEHVAALEDADAIAAALDRFVGALRTGNVAIPDQWIARHASRRARTADLARMLDEVVAP